MVAGHACLDITPIFPSERNSKLEPGKLLTVGKADIHPGGAVSNTGLAMHFFGADVKLLTKIGNDYFGQVIMQAYQDIDSNLKIDASASTSYSVVIAQPNIDRIFLHCSGVNDTFTGSDIDEADIADVDIVHFGYPTLMREMFLYEGAELTRLMRWLKQAGKVTSLDLSAVDVNSEAGKADWKKILANALPYVDLFLPSFEELCFMLNRSLYDRLSTYSEICLRLNLSDIKDLADSCHQQGASLIMIKCGCAGIYYSCLPNSVFLAKLGLPADEWGQSGFVDSFVPSNVKSANGAGDTAIAAFLSAMMRKYSLVDCVKLAAAAGASSVEGYHALSKLKTLDELKLIIDGGWKQQTLVKK